MPEFNRLISASLAVYPRLRYGDDAHWTTDRRGVNCDVCLAKNPYQRPCVGHRSIRAGRDILEDFDEMDFADEVLPVAIDLMGRALGGIDWDRILATAGSSAHARRKKFGHAGDIQPIDLWTALRHDQTYADESKTWDLMKADNDHAFDRWMSKAATRDRPVNRGLRRPGLPANPGDTPAGDDRL